MGYHDKKYAIIEIVNITETMVDECLESSMESLRRNAAETHAVLKWREGTGVPPSIAALDPAPTQYTHSQIITHINNPSNGWVVEVEE